MLKAKILCVDDTPANLEILSELLSEYDVIVAINASMALKILDKQKVDMILLDIMMPKVDGFELAQEIKSQKIFKNIPLLFISAKNDETTIERGYELGAVDYVSKPFKPKELLSRVKTHLRLCTLVNNLENEVEISLEKQRQQEHLLIKQSYAASMGEMIDVVAHQWKQPLNVVNMRISNILFDYQDGMIDEEYIENFQEKSFSQIRHLVSTLNDFRSFMSPHKDIEIFSAQDMIKSCITLIGDELKLHNIKIRVNKEDDFSINAIENEFIHIILNILNNAKEAFVLNKIYKPKIDISVNSATKTISIIDNAGGISEDHISSIFDLHFTSKKSTGGSGLGLYMSKMIISKYGGDIVVENKNDGALFTLKV